MGLIGLKYHPQPEDSLFMSPAWISALNCRVISCSLLSQGGPQFSSFPHAKLSPCFSPQLCSSHSFPISNGSSILPVAQAQTLTLSLTLLSYSPNHQCTFLAVLANYIQNLTTTDLLLRSHPGPVSHHLLLHLDYFRVS